MVKLWSELADGRCRSTFTWLYQCDSSYRLVIALSDASREETKQFAPGSSCGTAVASSTEVIAPRVVHRSLEHVHVTHVEPGEVDVTTTKSHECRRHDDVKSVQTVDRHVDSSDVMSRDGGDVMSTAVMKRLAWLRNTGLAMRSDGRLTCWKSENTDCASGSSSKMRKNTRTPRFTSWLLSILRTPSLTTVCCCSCDHVFRSSRFSSAVNRLWVSLEHNDWREGCEVVVGVSLWTGHLSNCACCETTFPIVRQQQKHDHAFVLFVTEKSRFCCDIEQLRRFEY